MPNIPKELHDLLAVADILIGPGAAVPSGNENEIDFASFLRPERIRDILTSNEIVCQEVTADGFCSCSPGAIVHLAQSRPDYHQFNAGVAQSAEQVTRNDEAVGSTPISSSKGFNESQRERLQTVVHRRVSLEEARSNRSQAVKDLDILEKDYKTKKAALERKIKECEDRGKHYQDRLLEAEDDLRKVIVEDLLVRGRELLEAKPAEKQPEPEQHEELGRPE